MQRRRRCGVDLGAGRRPVHGKVGALSLGGLSTLTLTVPTDVFRYRCRDTSAVRAASAGAVDVQNETLDRVR